MRKGAETVRLDIAAIDWIEAEGEYIRIHAGNDNYLERGSLTDAIISRVKIESALNIAEKRLPHDGRIAMKTGDEEYDLRVSIVPTKFGEAVCLRILGRQSLFLDLGQLGMEPSQEAVFAQLTQLPQGLVLLTGPTGSGKTTSLYTALAQANDEGRKIITFEDPIEYQL